jgi:hypothetical protein
VAVDEQAAIVPVAPEVAQRRDVGLAGDPDAGHDEAQGHGQRDHAGHEPADRGAWPAHVVTPAGHVRGPGHLTK